MPNYQMAKAGTHYTEPGRSFAWGINADKSEVVSIPEDQVSGRLQQHIANGRVIKTDRKATKQFKLAPSNRKLLTGEAARKHKAIPAGSVYSWRLDPVTGGRVKVAIKVPGHSSPIEEDGTTVDTTPVTGSGTPAESNDPGDADGSTEDVEMESGEADTDAGETTDEGTDATANETTTETTEETSESSDVGSDADDEPAGDAEDQRTKAQLKEELTAAGLPVSGNRDELIARLEEHAKGASTS